ncbi:lupus La protein [Nematocida minor]|uniref:lupus La protein n=1 Tax=Nematocida minor TaxID=1912983 RepID=UPI00221F253A|nr:lupus La protein [Nematocida minor]KAI5192423.1 lupus La protein [Nematocida minor]
MTQDENKLIIQQVEFYFSDANIVRDEFLKKLMLMNEGWAPLTVINSFGKIKAFKKTVSELESILKESSKLTVEDERIKRNTPIPSFQEHKGEEKTVLIRNFPVEYTLEDVQSALAPLKERIARIAMRKNALKEFKGSVFVELNEKEDIEIVKDSKLTIDIPVETEENESGNSSKKTKIELEVVDSKEYFDKKKEERREKKEEKRKEITKQIVNGFKSKIFKFTVAKGEEEASEEEINSLKISDIKQELLEKGIAFVDIPQRHIRMKNDEEEIAPISVKEFTISFTKLSEEEVEKYCEGLSLVADGKTLSKPRRKR